MEQWHDLQNDTTDSQLPMAEQCPASGRKEFPITGYQGKGPKYQQGWHLKSHFLFALVDHCGDRFACNIMA